MVEAVAVAFSMSWPAHAGQDGQGQGRGMLAGYRSEVYWCLGRRRDALFELADGAPRGAVVPDEGERSSIAPPS